nr:ribonuclease H-like domain-containing protein [Tanacetum cinerariifolium]
MRHFARDYRAKGNQDSRRRDAGYNGNKARYNGRRPAYQNDSKALVTIDGEGIDWSGHVKEDAQNYAMMAYSFSNSGSDNEESDLENTSVNDRYAKGLHAAPPPMTWNYMPSGPDVEIDYSKFTYGLKQTLVDESDAKTSDYTSCESDSSVETTTFMPAPIENAPKVVCKTKVWTDAPIIEEYDSDSDDDLVSNVQEDKEKPSFAFTDSVKHVKSFRENVKETSKPNHFPKVEKQGRNGNTTKGLGYAFTRKAYFFCGSFSHLIRDYDFHEKRMAKQAALTESKNKDDPHKALKDKGIFDSRCSMHMTRNKAHLADYQEFNGGSIAFRGSNERITGKGKIKAVRLDFEDVYYVEELKHYNLFYVSQMCNKKNKVLFTDTDCLVLSPDFKLPDENQAEAVNTACYVLNRVLVTKPQNKTRYKLLTGKGYAWMFNLDYLTNSMNYETVLVENQANKSVGPKEANNNAGTQANDDQGANSEEIYLHELEKLKRHKKEANDAANDAARKEATHENQDANTNSTNLLNVVSTPIRTVGPSRALNDGKPLYPDDPLMPHLEDIYASPSEGIFTDSSYDDEDKSKVNKSSEAHALISQALEDECWVDVMQVELLQFQIQKVWIFVDLPFGKKAIGTKWVYRNKKDKRGVVVRNKARLVAQVHRQEEGIDYDKVFAPVAKIEAIRIFLAFASYMGFIVYQIDVKGAFMYSTIDEEVYLTQPPGFVDPKFPKKVYKVVKALYGLHQAPRACVKTASTPIETQKPLVKDEEDADVDVHLYRSMIGSLMYLTTSRPDIMFAVCSCSRFQVTPKTSHLQAVKRIFRYLKGQPKLGLWYPKVSLFDLEAYSNSDYAGENLDRTSTTRGCQFLGMRLISWQCKKQTILATSTTEAEYVAAAHCCG